MHNNIFNISVFTFVNYPKKLELNSKRKKCFNQTATLSPGWESQNLFFFLNCLCISGWEGVTKTYRSWFLSSYHDGISRSKKKYVVSFVREDTELQKYQNECNFHTCQLHWLTSNEFIAVKKIFAMKIHRNEEEKFIALSILAWFLLFFGFFHNFWSKKSLDFKKKKPFLWFSLKFQFLANFPLEKSLFFSLQIHRIYTG